MSIGFKQKFLGGVRRHRAHGGSAGGFTLVELLVVIAIIALLAALLFPVLRQATNLAHGVSCVSNLRAIGQHVHEWMSINEVSQPWETADPGADWPHERHHTAPYTI